MVNTSSVSNFLTYGLSSISSSAGFRRIRFYAFLLDPDSLSFCGRSDHICGIRCEPYHHRHQISTAIYSASPPYPSGSPPVGPPPPSRPSSSPSAQPLHVSKSPLSSVGLDHLHRLHRRYLHPRPLRLRTLHRWKRRNRILHHFAASRHKKLYQ